MRRLALSVTLALLGAVTACADSAVTAPADQKVAAFEVSPAIVPTVTLSYVCGRTFGVTMSPMLGVMLASHTNRGAAVYQPMAGVSTYVDGRRLPTGEAATDAALRWPPRPGLLADTAHAITPCVSSPTPPPPGTFSLRHVCANSWMVENRNFVAFRFTWGAGIVAANRILEVPAASVAGPARLYFGTNLPRRLPVRLLFGDTVIANEPASNFEKCIAENPS
jgi:hypothetical protein